MTPTLIERIADSPLYSDLVNARISLWIHPGETKETISKLVGLPWSNVWNLSDVNFSETWTSVHGSNRLPFVVSDPAADDDNLQGTTFVRVYEISADKADVSANLRRIRIDQLKLKVSQIGGTIFVVGDSKKYEDDVRLIAELAPQLQLCIAGSNVAVATGVDRERRFFYWPSDVGALAEQAREVAAAGSLNATLFDAKHGSGVSVPKAVLDDIASDWTFVTPPKAAASLVDQDSFDRFINGEAEWNCYAAGAAYLRPLRVEAASKANIDFAAELLTILRDLERGGVDPRDALRQVVLFAEPASGTTTYVRQLAMTVAQAGYPTLLSNPMARRFQIRGLTSFIGTIQDLLWEQRKVHSQSGRDAASARIPFVVFVDKDAEDVVESKILAKALSSLGREILLVRFLERSRDEMNQSSGVHLLYSDVEQDQLVALGNHLRQFAIRHSLNPIPTETEWQAYHQGLRQVARYAPASGKTEIEELPYLFIVGIQPFISERISDVNSLEQYFYQKWDHIQNANVQKIIQIVAAAGVFSLSVPYNCLRRHPALSLEDIERPTSEVHRAVDMFVEWRNRGTNLAGWYLRIRHPIVGRLLCRAIDPIEGEVPFRPLLGLLHELTTKPDDLWFGETLAYRIGQNFKSNSPSFSLEIDTPLQRAARAVFDALPIPVKDLSRTIAHHEARYHIHVIHACVAALREPLTTTLTTSQIHSVLDEEMSRSSDWLDRALKIKGPGEADSNILNTYARLKFAYANCFREKQSEKYKLAFEEGLDLQEKAIDGDGTNGYALYQFVNEIIETVPANNWPARQQVELLSRAELRLTELIRLHHENRWRNIDPVDAEVQLGTLIGRHFEIISHLPGLKDLLDQFRIESPEAAIRIQIRLLVGNRTFEDAFTDRAVQEKIRALREDLLAVKNKTARGILYLYRLYLSDLKSRFDFRTRLALLAELKRKAPGQFLPYWHDEASLLCQLDNIPSGSQRFADLRAFRQAHEGQWFWLNEHILLIENGRLKPRPMTLVVVDPQNGWAKFQNLNIRAKFQLQHFPPMSRNHPFQAFVRFTIYGLQIVARENGLTRYGQTRLAMKPSVGRHQFFDEIAEGLLIAFGATPPDTVGIRANTKVAPIDDVSALARAISQQYPRSELAFEARVTNLATFSSPISPSILDAEQWALSDVKDLIDALVKNYIREHHFQLLEC